MKKMLAIILVAFIGVIYACGTTARTESKEDKKRICEALTDVHDWAEASRVMQEVVSYRDKSALQYVPNGVYNLEGYNSKVFTFDGVNSFYEVVCLNEEENFIIIIHNTGAHGVSFGSLIKKEAKFKGLSANYILFEEKSNMIAVSLKEREDVKIGEYAYDVIPFSELSREEQETAVYPKDSYRNSF